MSVIDLIRIAQITPGYRGVYTIGSLSEGRQFYNPNKKNCFFILIANPLVDYRWIAIVVDAQSCFLIDALCAEEYSIDVHMFIDSFQLGEIPVTRLPFRIVSSPNPSIPYVLFFSHFLTIYSMNVLFDKFDFAPNRYNHNESIVFQWFHWFI